MRLERIMSTAAIAVLALSAAGAFADPPQRVGRIAYTQGDVSVFLPDQQDWSPAARNFPVADDEAVWTAEGALAQLQMGPIETFLDSRTELSIDKLDYGVAAFTLSEGDVHVELARYPEGGVLIRTQQGEVRLTAAGAYRIDAGEGDGSPLRVTVLSGRAQLAGPDILVPIEAGQTATVRDDFRIAIAPGGPVGLDNFARRQLDAERYAATPRYVSEEYTGYEDLDANGVWEQTPDYGAIWYPRAVSADWQPYRYGHWAYVSPWGWTWIDDAPWGFAPFHYGRWVDIRGRWAWAPGEFARRPVYAPALVSFFGGGPGAGIGLSVGWVPLAPFEIYRPYYPVSTAYVRNLNITSVNRSVVNQITVENIHNETIVYRNDHARTFVSQNDFARAAPVQRTVLNAPPVAGGAPRQAFNIGQLRPAPEAHLGGASTASAATARPPTWRPGVPRPTVSAPATPVSPSASVTLVSPAGRSGSSDQAGRRPFDSGDGRRPPPPGPAAPGATSGAAPSAASAGAAVIGDTHRVDRGLPTTPVQRAASAPLTPSQPPPLPGSPPTGQRDHRWETGADRHTGGPPAQNVQDRRGPPDPGARAAPAPAPTLSAPPPRAQPPGRPGPAARAEPGRPEGQRQHREGDAQPN